MIRACTLSLGVFTQKIKYKECNITFGICDILGTFQVNPEYLLGLDKLKGKVTVKYFWHVWRTVQTLLIMEQVHYSPFSENRRFLMTWRSGHSPSF